MKLIHKWAKVYNKKVINYTVKYSALVHMAETHELVCILRHMNSC